MDNTIVGVFGDYSTAERVARDLTNAGIPRTAIDVRSHYRTGAAGRGFENGEEEGGGISGFFRRMFGGEETGGRYAEAVERGNAVVCVTAAEGQLDQAVEIMNSAGAIDIDRREETVERADLRGSTEGGSVPVIEEELQVGKRAVQRGGVRVYSRVVDEPVEETVELRDERVTVDRRTVDRPVERGELSGLRDQTIEVMEVTEEPVVQKRARVREEVVVGKETSQRTEKVRDTVRRTEVEVEHLGGDDYRSDFRRDWEARYAGAGEPYETYEPAYDYGYRSANEPRWRGRKWSDVESELRTDWERRNPNSTWERFKDSVRYGWEKVTGKR